MSGGHAGRAHALLSASSAHRWLECTASPRMEETRPDTTSPAAAEGTLAHEVAEYELHKALGRDYEGEPPTPADADMQRHATTYADYVEALATSPDDVEIEAQVGYRTYVPGGYGTADAIVYNPDTRALHVVDFKYGVRVQVEAYQNPQLMLYALGALDYYDLAVGPVETIVLHIFQPRASSVSTYTITPDMLRAWGEFIVKPRAARAWDGEGEFRPGPWCGFCKALPVCQAHAVRNQQIAAVELAGPELNDHQTSEVITRAAEITSWLKKVEAHATKQALDGHQYPGLKLVAKTARRVVANPAGAIEAAREAGYQDQDILERKLIGITALEKLMGKKEFTQIVGPYVDKPRGAPQLAPLSDKRPVYQPAPEADFQEGN